MLVSFIAVRMTVSWQGTSIQPQPLHLSVWFIHSTTSPSSGKSGELFSRWTVLSLGCIWKFVSDCKCMLGYYFFIKFNLFNLLLWGWGLYKRGEQLAAILAKCKGFYGYSACQKYLIHKPGSTSSTLRHRYKCKLKTVVYVIMILNTSWV